MDEYDDIALHVVVFDGEEPIGVLRAIPKDNNMLKIIITIRNVNTGKVSVQIILLEHLNFPY
ncbi:hypothetical protein [Xenorhabdus eapokensis]|uniref:hypothetical protein n=1 Tax=Xenorhabdus eapokensis TaxID=1873482 RepID=UPI003BB61ECB